MEPLYLAWTRVQQIQGVVVAVAERVFQSGILRQGLELVFRALGAEMGELEDLLMLRHSWRTLEISSSRAT